MADIGEDFELGEILLIMAVIGFILFLGYEGLKAVLALFSCCSSSSGSGNSISSKVGSGIAGNIENRVNAAIQGASNAAQSEARTVWSIFTAPFKIATDVGASLHDLIFGKSCVASCAGKSTGSAVSSAIPVSAAGSPACNGGAPANANAQVCCQQSTGMCLFLSGGA